MHPKLKSLIEIGTRYNYKTERDAKIGYAIVSLYNYHSLLNNNEALSMLYSLLDQYMVYVKETIEKEGFNTSQKKVKIMDDSYEVECEYVSFQPMPPEVASVIFQKAKLRGENTDALVMNLNKKL